MPAEQNENLYIVSGIILNLFQIFSLISIVIFIEKYLKSKRYRDSSKSNYNFFTLYLFFSIIEIAIFVFVTIKSNDKNNKILSNKTILDCLLYSYSIYFLIKFLIRILDTVSKSPIVEQKGNPYIKYIRILKFIKIVLSTHSLVNFIIVKSNVILPKSKRIFLGIIIPLSIYIFLQLFSLLVRKVRDKFNYRYTKKVLRLVKKKRGKIKKRTYVKKTHEHIR
jgi:hypothetical protein